MDPNKGLGNSLPDDSLGLQDAMEKDRTPNVKGERQRDGWHRSKTPQNPRGLSARSTSFNRSPASRMDRDARAEGRREGLPLPPAVDELRRSSTRKGHVAKPKGTHAPRHPSPYLTGACRETIHPQDQRRVGDDRSRLRLELGARTGAVHLPRDNDGAEKVSKR